MFHTTLPRGAGQALARDVPQHHRQRGDRARLRDRGASWPSATCSTARYPITPASDILHQLASYKNFGVKTFQAEDEIAAIGVGHRRVLRRRAGHDRQLGARASRSRREAMGLAVMVELPLVVIDVQRAGPSTGMPTKTEQADLLQVMFGRNSDSPMPIVAPATPAECFDYAIEAWRIALKYMTPGHLPVRRVPGQRRRAVEDPGHRRPARTSRSTTGPVKETFHPYDRDPHTLARPWAVPGTPGLEHRIGGLEKADITGNVSYDPENHHRMQTLRAAEGRRHRRRHPRSRGLRAGAAASC